MGVSSKQVISRDDLDWSSHTHSQSQTLDTPRPFQAIRRQQNQEQAEPLQCPRCDSTNTKFCYYNNYKKSQPRHFCKTCRRHWTKGGTLRNVPFGGGGRNNKRFKSAINTTTSATTTTSSNSIREIFKRVKPSLEIRVQGVGDQKSISNMLYQDNSNNLNGIFMSSALFPPQNQSLGFPYPISSCFDTRPNDPTPTSFVSSSFYDYNSQEALEDSTITTIVPSTSSSIMWQVANASNELDYWNLDDIDDLVSTDLNVTWDDQEVKP